VKPIDELAERIAIVADINGILASCGITQTVSPADIIITEQTVSDGVKAHPKLSGVITDFLWPSVNAAIVYHYTTREAAESILNTGIFRLSNIANRYSEGEIVTFCETHNLQGYLEKDINGDPRYKSLIMPNTFYASFADVSITPDQEEYFWRNFGFNDGVRLRIEVVASNPNFRRMFYEQKKGVPIRVLSELTRCIREKYGRAFILNGISRLCSFYLSGEKFAKENEIRCLYRVWEGVGPQPKGNAADSYVELPLNAKSEFGYQLTVTEVHTATPINVPSTYPFSKRGA